MYHSASIKSLRLLGGLVIVLALASGCQGASQNISQEVGVLTIPPTPTLEVIEVTPVTTETEALPLVVTPASVRTASGEIALYQDPTQPVEARVKDLLARMSIEEKIGQMMQPDGATPAEVTTLGIGSVLVGGDGTPGDDSPAAWQALVQSYEEAAQKSRLGIPLIFGWDAVHGSGHLKGGTLFPQQVGLGEVGS